MEWLEVTGKTIAQAEEAALDRLGVDRSEAEFAVVDEPKSALLGLRKTEARIRARVRPVLPREKRSRNRRPANNRDRGRNRKPERGNLKENRNRGGQGGQGKSRGSKSPSGERRQPENEKRPQNAGKNSGKSNSGAGKSRPSKPLEGTKRGRANPWKIR